MTATYATICSSEVSCYEQWPTTNSMTEAANTLCIFYMYMQSAK